ncbi:MAG: cytochrome c [Hyphomicrobiaceae bacterium]|nr:cytochrome c [Hyphomicrobiaceae bacterium]
MVSRNRHMAAGRWRIVSGVAAFVLAAAVPAQSSAAVDIARGKELAEKLCAVCHLNPGQGDKTSPSAVPGFVAVARRPGQNLEGIIAWLRSVPPMMPDHHLSQDEMEAIAFYILSLADEAPSGPAK